MNPSVGQDFVNREFERDPASAVAEYGAEFRSDIAEFVPLAVPHSRPAWTRNVRCTPCVPRCRTGHFYIILEGTARSVVPSFWPGELV